MLLASLWHDISQGALTWLPIFFFGLIAVILWRTIQLMPRVKPKLVEPNSRTSVIVQRRRGGRGREGRAPGGDRLPAGAEALRTAGRARTRRAFCSTARRAPARRCSRRPSRTSRVPPSTRRARRRSSRCSPDSAPRASASSSTTARKNAPSIIFIDELDAVGAARSGDGFNREQDQTLNQLLVELDGFGTADQVVVMGASNRIQDLDPALLRPGRFDRQLLVAPPDLAGREAILEVHTRGKPLAEDVDLHAVARQTAGLAGADLANICNEAAIFAGRRNLDRDRPGRVRGGDGAGRRRPSAAPCGQREGEADPRLPRGRARADVVPDGRGAAGAQGDDRLARPGARLHAQPADRGPLPAHQGRARST